MNVRLLQIGLEISKPWLFSLKFICNGNYSSVDVLVDHHPIRIRQLIEIAENEETVRKCYFSEGVAGKALFEMADKGFAVCCVGANIFG
jgi:hypothetical protein